MSARFSAYDACSPAYRAVRTPGRPPSASTNSPVSSATAGSPAAAQIAAAFSRALPIRSGASSSTSGTSTGRGTSSTTPRSSAAISTTLSGFADAQTSVITRAASRRVRRAVSASTCAWSDMISSIPDCASASIASRRWRLNGCPSAVPCTSTNSASGTTSASTFEITLVITTFMSTSAVLSSSYGRSSTAVPFTTPTLIAAQNEWSGWRVIAPDWTTRVRASCSATKPPQMLAVRVPPSACSTSQSTMTWRSPRSRMSHDARRARPIRRWISTVRPLCLPFAASRSTRSGDEPGSIEYSAVTHPFPFPFIHRGTSASTLAVQSTRVRPKLTSTLPPAISV